MMSSVVSNAAIFIFYYRYRFIPVRTPTTLVKCGLVYVILLLIRSFIFPGDVVLENLILKQNALEELNIPVQTVYGHLGTYL